MCAVLWLSSVVSADTWRLVTDDGWQPVSNQGQDRFAAAVAEVKRLVGEGRSKEAKKAFEELEGEFPEIAGPDFDAFEKAELLYCRNKFSEASRSYDNLLARYPDTKFRTAAIDRQFSIGTAYLSGRKVSILGIIWLKGDSEGIRVMERVTDHSGMDSPLGLKAATMIARNYEGRRKFDEAYLKWWEISLSYGSGEAGKEALLGMARNKFDSYNKPGPFKRAAYDGSRLRTAETYFSRLESYYPADANNMDVRGTLETIHEQMAEKQLSIAEFYDRTGKKQAANLYYDMVISDFPGTRAAGTAEQVRSGTAGAAPRKEEK